MDAVNWGVQDIDWKLVSGVWKYSKIADADRRSHSPASQGFPDIEIICAKGRNTCPDRLSEISKLGKA